ncbi:MAG: ADP-ribosylglycohydrolase family protein [Methanobrevibacter sp.]|uniref:ADP-ribosylglycohydrolase family protein n=1 Tax=Methanobrevibacter sp. TaxID=66852 RepID=UPI003F01DF7C
MKVKDGIIGLVVGDALGVPVEFYSRENLKNHPVTGMRSYGTYNKPAGTWSDDTSLTIATMASIINKKCIDYTDIIEEFIEWQKNNKYCQEETFDIGTTTYEALTSYTPGSTPFCGRTDYRNNGNGSLMRILPLAFINNIDYKTIEKVSSLTHGHKISRIACVLYIEIAKSMINNSNLSIKEHVKTASAKIMEYYKNSEELIHFKRIFDDDYSKGISSTGFVIYTFEAVIYCLENTDNYKDAVLKAINLGEDTDTVAAICGGLAGIYYGFDEIPIDWINQIRQIETIFDLCEKYEVVCDEYL